MNLLRRLTEGSANILIPALVFFAFQPAQRNDAAQMLSRKADTPGDVADPWYSDRFDIAYADILRGCEALLSHLENE